MTPADEREAILCREALQRPNGPEREAFLNQACSGDQALRTRLEALLQAHANPNPVREPPAVAPAFGEDETSRREIESMVETQGATGVVLGKSGTEPMRLPPEGDHGGFSLVGTQLGLYKVEALIGAGGMGEVYRARDSRLQRAVALKVLPREFSFDPERLARLEREARMLAALNHPNIATIHGLEEAGATRFLVLELVEGQTVAERLKRGRIPLEEVLDLGRQMAEGLEAAHERGIIHRDLKPANVKITPEGKGVQDKKVAGLHEVRRFRRPWRWFAVRADVGSRSGPIVRFPGRNGCPGCCALPGDPRTSPIA